MAFQVTLVPGEMFVTFGCHRNPDEVETPFTTTALLAAGAIANKATSAIAGISSFSRLTTALLTCRYVEPTVGGQNGSAHQQNTDLVTAYDWPRTIATEVPLTTYALAP